MACRCNCYLGKELQIIDNRAEKHAKLKEYQLHGSIYGVAPAKRGFMNPVGEWNYEEVIVKDNRIKVILNGEVILESEIVVVCKAEGVKLIIRKETAQ